MRRYRFRLAPVLRVRQAEEDAATTDLMRANADVAAKVQNLAAAVDRHDRRAVVDSAVTADTFMMRQWRAARSAEAVAGAAAARQEAEVLADEARQAWAEAARKVAVLERLNDRRRAAHRLAADRAEDAEINEINVGRHGRQQ